MKSHFIQRIAIQSTFETVYHAPYALSVAKKVRLSDFQSQILITVCPQGSDFTISVQVGVHPGQRDYVQKPRRNIPRPREILLYRQNFKSTGICIDMYDWEDLMIAKISGI
jgi:hypothetical protein